MSYCVLLLSHPEKIHWCCHKVCCVRGSRGRKGPRWESSSRRWRSLRVWSLSLPGSVDTWRTKFGSGESLEKSDIFLNNSKQPKSPIVNKAQSIPQPLNQSGHRTTYLDELWMLHELMVKHIAEAKSSQAQVDQHCSQVGQQPQAEDLTQSPVLRPWGRINVRSEDITVSNVQHMIHGTVCEESECVV